MSEYRDPSVLIKKAGSLVRGERYIELRIICDSQKTVSTRKLARIVEELEQSDRREAKQLKALADVIR